MWNDVFTLAFRRQFISFVCAVAVVLGATTTVDVVLRRQETPPDFISPFCYLCLGLPWVCHYLTGRMNCLTFGDTPWCLLLHCVVVVGFFSGWVSSKVSRSFHLDFRWHVFWHTVAALKQWIAATYSLTHTKSSTYYNISTMLTNFGSRLWGNCCQGSSSVVAWSGS